MISIILTVSFISQYFPVNIFLKYGTRPRRVYIWQTLLKPIQLRMNTMKVILLMNFVFLAFSMSIQVFKKMRSAINWLLFSLTRFYVQWLLTEELPILTKSLMRCYVLVVLKCLIMFSDEFPNKTYTQIDTFQSNKYFLAWIFIILYLIPQSQRHRQYQGWCRRVRPRKR